MIHSYLACFFCGISHGFPWQVAVPALDCACLACPELPRVYEAFATEGFASPEPEKYLPVLCPMRLGPVWNRQGFPS